MFTLVSLQETLILLLNSKPVQDSMLKLKFRNWMILIKQKKFFVSLNLSSINFKQDRLYFVIPISNIMLQNLGVTCLDGIQT